jgi:uncharacterized SAM-binding protein YcdF (DUF218 family)
VRRRQTHHVTLLTLPMLEPLARLLISLLLPSALLTLLLAATGWFALRRAWAPLRRTVFALGAFLLLAGTRPLPDAVAASLEDRYRPLATHERPAAPAHIVVLAAGHVADTTLPPLARLQAGTLARLVEGVRKYHQHPGSVLIVSGASRFDPQPQAATTAAAAVSLGVPAAAIRRLDDPTTTCGEARAFVRTFGTEKPVVLVTSALHLPRAVQLFEQLGVTVIPAPADFHVKRSAYGPQPWLHASLRHIATLDAVMHEYIGMLWGRWSCRPL